MRLGCTFGCVYSEHAGAGAEGGLDSSLFLLLAFRHPACLDMRRQTSPFHSGSESRVRETSQLPAVPSTFFPCSRALMVEDAASRSLSPYPMAVRWPCLLAASPIPNLWQLRLVPCIDIWPTSLEASHARGVLLRGLNCV